MATFRSEEPQSFLGPIVIFCENKIKKLPFPLLFEADSLILFTTNRHTVIATGLQQCTIHYHRPLSMMAMFTTWVTCRVGVEIIHEGIRGGRGDTIAC